MALQVGVMYSHPGEKQWRWCSACAKLHPHAVDRRHSSCEICRKCADYLPCVCANVCVVCMCGMYGMFAVFLAAGDTAPHRCMWSLNSVLLADVQRNLPAASGRSGLCPPTSPLRRQPGGESVAARRCPSPPAHIYAEGLCGQPNNGKQARSRRRRSVAGQGGVYRKPFARWCGSCVKAKGIVGAVNAQVPSAKHFPRAILPSPFGSDNKLKCAQFESEIVAPERGPLLSPPRIPEGPTHDT